MGKVVDWLLGRSPQKPREPEVAFEVDFNDDGTINCDIVTVLFGMGQGSKMQDFFIPHSDSQLSYDMFWIAICIAAAAAAEESFRGSWQVWKIRQGKVERERVEAMFLAKMIPPSQNGENGLPSQT